MRGIFLALALMAGTLHAEDEPLALTGKIGVGFDTITGASPESASSLIPGLGAISQPNAVAVRYWVSEKLSWEGQLALNYTSQPNPISGTTTNSGYGLGTLIKYNFARPFSNVLVQFLGGVSLAGLSQSPDSSASSGTTTMTFQLMVGTGFEAFMPFWRALSLEGNVGLRASTTQTKSNGSAAAQSSSAIGIGGSGFTPVNVALHYYF